MKGTTMMWPVRIVWLWTLVMGPVYGATHYVDPLSPLPVYPYTSGWEHASHTIAEAVNAAGGGSVIMVAAGSYPVTSEIVVSTALEIRAAQAVDAPEIDGLGLTRVFRLTHPQALLQGLRIVNGFAAQGGGIYLSAGIVDGCSISSNTAAQGGGVFMNGGGELRGCLIHGNTGTTEAGGVYIANRGTLRSCVVQANRSSDDGGGLMIRNGTGSVVEECEFIDNESDDDGGAIYLRDTQAVIRRCTIRGNRAVDKGGGIYCRDSGGLIENCLITDNRTVSMSSTSPSVPPGGGGVYLSPAMTMRHCTVIGNASAARGNGVFVWNASPIIQNCIIVSNGDENWYQYLTNAPCAMSYTCTTPAHPGLGNTTNDAALVWSTDGYPVPTQRSACLDSGASLFEVSVDLIGRSRPLDGNGNGIALWDMGAIEVVPPDVDSDGDGVPDGHELIANTDATNAQSFLHFSGIAAEPGGVRLHWRGGTRATQVIEACAPTGAEAFVWAPVLTNLPPTQEQESRFMDSQGPMDTRLYRIRVFQ